MNRFSRVSFLSLGCGASHLCAQEEGIQQVTRPFVVCLRDRRCPCKGRKSCRHRHLRQQSRMNLCHQHLHRLHQSAKTMIHRRHRPHQRAKTMIRRRHHRQRTPMVKVKLMHPWKSGRHTSPNAVQQDTMCPSGTRAAARGLRRANRLPQLALPGWRKSSRKEAGHHFRKVPMPLATDRLQRRLPMVAGMQDGATRV